MKISVNMLKNSKKIDWIMLAVVLFLFFLTELYCDIQLTYPESMNLLNAIVHLDPFNVDKYGGVGAYPMPMYLVFAIWSIPVYIINLFTSSDIIRSPWAYYWAKCLYFVLSIGIVFYMKKIWDMINKNENRNELLFLMASSWFYVIPVFVMTRYDIVYVFFMTLGYYYYLKDEEKIKLRTIVLLLWAACINYLPIFFIIPIIILKDKIIIKYSLCLIPLVLVFVIVKTPAGALASLSGGFLNNMFNKFYVAEVEGGMGRIYLFFVAYVAICFYAFMKKVDSKEELISYSSWISAAVYLIFTAFANIHPQWTMLVLPFIFIIIAKNRGLYKTNVALETIMSIAIFIKFIIYYPYAFFSTAYLDQLIFRILNISPAMEREAVYYVNELSLFIFLEDIGYAVFLVSATIFLFINRPWKKDSIITGERENIKDLILIRNSSLIIYFILEMMVYFA